MPEKDIPNTVLGRMLSLEFLGMLVVIGISWGSIITRVSGLDDQVAENKAQSSYAVSEIKTETGALKGEVVTINRKLDVMANNQEHFKDQIQALDGRLDRILDILEDGEKKKARAE